MIDNAKHIKNCFFPLTAKNTGKNIAKWNKKTKLICFGATNSPRWSAPQSPLWWCFHPPQPRQIHSQWWRISYHGLGIPKCGSAMLSCQNQEILWARSQAQLLTWNRAKKTQEMWTWNKRYAARETWANNQKKTSKKWWNGPHVSCNFPCNS